MRRVPIAMSYHPRGTCLAPKGAPRLLDQPLKKEGKKEEREKKDKRKKGEKKRREEKRKTMGK